MLTADLVQYTRRSGKVRPRLIDPNDPGLLDAAEALIALCEAHVGQPRHDLEAALRDGWPPERPLKTGQALARLLLERGDFDVDSEVEPAALRGHLATLAAASWREAAQAGTPPWRKELLAKAGEKLGLEPARIEEALFADLQDQQILERWEPIEPGALLYLYNTAQVQGLLVRCESLRIDAPWPHALRLRQLFGYLKFFGLLFRMDEDAAREERLSLVMDGPLAVLDSASRYGRQLAQFFPALLLWDQPWRLTAEVRPGKRGEGALLELEPQPRLRSHYPDRGLWVAEEIQRFTDTFNARDYAWRAEPSQALFALPGNRPCVPDLTFRHKDSGQEAHLEWFPHPDPERMAGRREDLRRAGLAHVIPACRGTPPMRKLAKTWPELLVFRRGLLPAPVRERLDDLPAGG